jgi:hypothetical protein
MSVAMIEVERTGVCGPPGRDGARPRLSDEEAVALALCVLRDARVWAASEFAEIAEPLRRDAVRRVGFMLQEALATV